jgi:hypothetical protein
MIKDQTKPKEPFWPPLRPLYEEFGEDPDPNLFTDLSEEPGPTSTAARHAAQYQAQEQDAARDRDLARLGHAAQEQREDEALEQAQRLIRLGRKVPTGTRLLAVRALERRGVQTLSSAELLAGRS